MSRVLAPQRKVRPIRSPRWTLKPILTSSAKPTASACTGGQPAVLCGVDVQGHATGRWDEPGESTSPRSTWIAAQTLLS